MSYKATIIYYWSGTGNTLRIAKWVYSFLKSQVSPIRFSSIIDANPDIQMKHGSDLLLVLAMPTHGFTAPWPVIKFTLHLPMGKKTNVATIANGAGYNYFGLLLPGFTGSVNFLISLILLIKGYRIQGCIAIDMPGSWPAVCPALKKKDIDFFLNKAKRKTETFIKTILFGKKYIINVRNCIEFIFGIGLIPISLGYILYGRFFFAKLQFANLKCNSCGICALNCSHKAIIMKGKAGLKKPFWTFKCESCGRCISYCPQSAIETGHSMGLLIWYMISLTSSIYTYNYIFQSIAINELLTNKYIVKIFNYGMFVFTIYVCYYILYYSIKIPCINKFFTYTSGTHWWNKYHEPSIKLEEFHSSQLEGHVEDK